MTTETPSGQLGPIITYFETHPKLRRLRMTAADLVLKRRVTNGRTSIVVTDNRAWGSDTMHGRISHDGVWQDTIRRDIADATEAALIAVALDVENAMIEDGKTSGVCSFCGRALTDPESVEYGYGPVCAKKYGLPHSNRNGF